ncbi:hypothetical protein BOX30_02160 [Leptospirillum ferriphilum]|uniref:Uncharacterized protein n=1 Tax=Leptospirillum ferriphilum TaxID=178606 RepID=A0A1V3SU12_9BACT|nr:hypothetical protein ABH19_13480 [Leptospirillum sp. Group II 'CF-1']OOH71604.1 hypothetical protein BOX24_08845 [Leptospirillum ferriphilum]OOH83762.1 hypothetical protein BOX30_02160 [Leptospirillum ferriphilum]
MTNQRTFGFLIKSNCPEVYLLPLLSLGKYPVRGSMAINFYRNSDWVSPSDLKCECLLILSGGKKTFIGALKC